MEIKIFGPTWGLLEGSSLEEKVRTLHKAGFQGVETDVPTSPAERDRFCAVLEELGMGLIVQVYTSGNSPMEHARSFEEQYRNAVPTRPWMVNSHTGKDYYSLAENQGIYRHASRLEAELGVPVVHEIHRGRATFNTRATAALIEAMPQSRFVADFSHWCVVHESLLQDQSEDVNLAIAHCYHIHARVGHGEGPQVNDPRAPEWKEALEIHMGWWQKIIDARRAEGIKAMPVTPEFGPPAYLPTLPYTRMPVVDQFEVNCFMKDLVREKLVA
jgi:hypothetical protein